MSHLQGVVLYTTKSSSIAYEDFGMLPNSNKHRQRHPSIQRGVDDTIGVVHILLGGTITVNKSHCAFNVPTTILFGLYDRAAQIWVIAVARWHALVSSHLQGPTWECRICRHLCLWWCSDKLLTSLLFLKPHPCKSSNDVVCHLQIYLLAADSCCGSDYSSSWTNTTTPAHQLCIDIPHFKSHTITERNVARLSPTSVLH